MSSNSFCNSHIISIKLVNVSFLPQYKHRTTNSSPLGCVEKYSSEINTDLVKIKKAGEELEKTKGLKTREAVEKEAAKIRDQEVDLQAKAKKYEENWKEEAQRESQKVFEEARLSIKEIAEKNKLSAMIEVNAAPYICDEDNYTDQVKSTMDSKYEQKTKTA